MGVSGVSRILRLENVIQPIPRMAEADAEPSVKIAALAPFRRAPTEVWISACVFSVVKSKPVIFNLSVRAG
jgi:hypothetical protein